MGKTIPAGAPPALDLDRCALFLDYDGTLVDLAPTPAEALADAELRELLAALQVRLTGALAIVTGRPVADIDGFLAPLRLTVAGLHGLVRRRHDGDLTEAALPPGLMAPVRAGAGELRGRPSRNHGRGQAFELGLALSPGARGGSGGEPARAAAGRGQRRAIAAAAGKDGGGASAGRQRQGRGDRGPARRAGFPGRTPVFVGDDVTDEAGFRSVNALGGVSIRVGDGPTEAAHRLSDVATLRRWLAQTAHA